MTHWTLKSNAADVLSLGPRTAGRLLQLGVRSVGDLLAAEPQTIAQRLRDERFTAQTVADWQREAQLLVEAPDFPTEAARLLAVVGYSSAQRVARATPTELLAALEQLPDQPRRAGWISRQHLPSVQAVNTWIRCAQQSLAARAA